MYREDNMVLHEVQDIFQTYTKNFFPFKINNNVDHILGG